ncbi:hypothetical protein GGQ73_001631 [Rhizobium skierniewicense]|uniref:Uncharacterized protein n=1 Tax=Rhizobium skierniewicense TaxID=984260 RepID=A0A7W6G2N9_9HYPH|nr:hypothetical protein [Rhizobium skierniewicense]MBB3945696.1 hypothetical protein [Rhizobium skierniewicense]
MESFFVASYLANVTAFYGNSGHGCGTVMDFLRGPDIDPVHHHGRCGIFDMDAGFRFATGLSKDKVG